MRIQKQYIDYDRKCKKYFYPQKAQQTCSFHFANSDSFYDDFAFPILHYLSWYNIYDKG